ncbi:MAG: heme ABC transporter permease [Gammaproteobacteria bacterium]
MNWSWFHKLGSPPHLYRIAGGLVPWFGWTALVLVLGGLYGGLWLAPPDYQMGDGFRIIYVHVPSAWMSMAAYAFLAVSAAIGLVWRIKLAELAARNAAPLGAVFTALTLATGSLWGKPMWGTWWEWDARMTSELVLLFLYLGYIALHDAFPERRTGARASAVLALVGVVNLPIIHYSVEWWHSLHQPATITKFGAPSIDTEMLVPLLLMATGFTAWFATALLMRLRVAVVEHERGAAWVRALGVRNG